MPQPEAWERITGRPERRPAYTAGSGRRDHRANISRFGQNSRDSGSPPDRRNASLQVFTSRQARQTFTAWRTARASESPAVLLQSTSCRRAIHPNSVACSSNHRVPSMTAPCLRRLGDRPGSETSATVTRVPEPVVVLEQVRPRPLNPTADRSGRPARAQSQQNGRLRPPARSRARSRSGIAGGATGGTPHRGCTAHRRQSAARTP